LPTDDGDADRHLLRGISQLLGQEPFIERPYCQVSFRHAWLLQAAAVGAQKLIDARHPFSFDPTILGILFGLRVGREWYTDLHTKDFKFEELLQGWPALNRASFWHDVEFARSRVMLRPGDRLIYFGQASVFGAFWSFNASDFDYVCEQIAQQSSPDNKLVALSVAFNLYVKESRKAKWRRQMKNTASCDAEVQQALDSYLRPPARNETWQKEERKWRRQSAAHRKREAENREKSREWLTSHVEDIRHPKLEDPTAISQAQLYLHERTREKEESSNKWGGGRWEDLVAEYGEDVAVAYRDAAVGYWRRYKPILRSEGAATNSTPWSVVFGLTGLSIEAGEQAGWPSALSQHEVQLACRYACHELNGLLSSTQSSRHSGSNVACPRSSPATKPAIKSPPIQ
jgi:hypothetical protein